MSQHKHQININLTSSAVVLSHVGGERLYGKADAEIPFLHNHKMRRLES